MNIVTISGVLVCLFALSLAAPRNILFNGLAITLVGPPYSLQLLPLTVNDPRQQWTIEANGVISSVFDTNIVLDVQSSSVVGGTRVIAWQRANALNQRWVVNADGSIRSLLANNYYLGPDVDPTSQFLEVDYNTPQPAVIKAPIDLYVCTSYNDPHIYKFPCGDARALEAHQTGRFALASFGNVRVSSTHVLCYPGNPNIACNNRANIRVAPNAAIEIQGDTVYLAGVPQPFPPNPQTIGGAVVNRVGPGHFIVNVPNGYIEVKGATTAPFLLNIKVVVTGGPIPDGGLCACRDGPNAGGNKRSTLSPAQFVNSWKYTDFCDDPFWYPPNTPIGDYEVLNPPTGPTNPPVITFDDPVRLANAQALCAPLLTGDLVEACGEVTDPADFYQNCLRDVYLTQDSQWAAVVIDAYDSHCSSEAGTRANPAKTTANGEGLNSPIYAGDTLTFTIQVRLANGRPKTTGGDNVQVVITGTTFVDVVDNEDGSYTVTYEQVQIEPFTITVTVNGVQIAGSPFQLEAW